MNVAILGLGTVGRGVYDLLQEHNDINVSYVLERNPELTMGLDVRIASSFDDILTDDDVDVIIELIGGTTTALSYIRQALDHGKHVVTANKAVISRHYKDLNERAKHAKVHLCYEASVGGAIIVLDPLMTIAKVNRISRIDGIVNGATNYVLSRLYQDNLSLDEAIQEAFEKGYLETGTTDDMDGLDAMRKINILSMIAYRGYLNEEMVARVPLSSLTASFHEYVKHKGHVVKYIASSQWHQGNVAISVMPVVLESNSSDAQVSYEWNVIHLHGAHHKTQTFIGQGAGRYPTASAVVYDLVSILENNVRTISYPNHLAVDNNSIHHRYLVEMEDGCVLTEPMSFEEMQSDDKAICFARWEVRE